MKKIMMVVLVLFITINVQAQDSKQFFIGLGGNNTSFQDLKYSKVHYTGLGGTFELGFQKNKTQSIWGYGLTFPVSFENAATHENGQVTGFNPRIHTHYLQQIKDKLWIGGRWDILDFNLRNTKGLGNNSLYYIVGSNLYASGQYQIPLKGQMKLNIGLDLGLLTYFKESTSFAFSAPQNGLEDGEFDYQNEALENPFGLKYYVFRPLGKNIDIRTIFDLQVNERWSVVYQWNMRRFAEVKGFPVTRGSHLLTFRYNISYKTVEAKS